MDPPLGSANFQTRWEKNQKNTGGDRHTEGVGHPRGWTPRRTQKLRGQTRRGMNTQGGWTGHPWSGIDTRGGRKSREGLLNRRDGLTRWDGHLGGWTHREVLTNLEKGGLGKSGELKALSYQKKACTACQIFNYTYDPFIML